MGVGVGSGAWPEEPPDELPPLPLEPLPALVAARVVGVAVAASVGDGLGDGVAVGDGCGVEVRVGVAVDVAGVCWPAPASFGPSPSSVRKNTPPAAMAMPRMPRTVQPSACRAGVLKND